MTKNESTFCAVLASLLLCTGLHASIIYVKADAAGANNGTSWFDAYTDLQPALGAPNGSQVWIAAGTYKPGSTRDATFTVNTISLYGGFAGTETDLSQRNLVNNRTILSGEIGASGPDDNCYHVVYVQTGQTAALDGLTITRGNSAGDSPYGAGIISYGTVNVANCRIIDNRGDQGAGVTVIGSTGSTIVNSVFFGNHASFGAALYLLGSGYVEGCTFSGNIASSYGVIFAAQATGNPQFRNIIIWGNPANDPLIYSSYGVYDVASSIIEGQTTSDPMFVDAGGGDLRLRAGSPAIDAGNTGFVPGGVTLDADGAPRVSGTTVDIGAYEFGPDRLTVTRFGSGTGTVASVPAAITCGATCVATALIPGAQYQLTATPDPGFQFTGWGGSCSGVGTCTVNVPASVTAHFGHVFYVKASAAGANDGTSWTDAFTDLQSALAAAAAGDEIWVAAGTYTPTATTDRSISFALKSGVAIYGGFAGTETSRAQRAPATNVTTLSGDIGTLGDNSDNSNTVVTAVLVDSGAVLDGFTIADGNGGSGNSPAPPGTGAGLRFFIAYAQISNCTFVANNADSNGGLGGAIAAYGGGGTISDCLITGNSAPTGGGVYTQSVRSFSMWRSTFVNNTAYGSAVYARGGRPLFDSCRMHDNHGGFPTVFLFYITGNDPNAPVFRNCEIIGTDPNNTVMSQSSGTFLNCTIVGPSSTAMDGSALRVQNSPGAYYPQVNVINAILWGNANPNLNYYNDGGGTFANNLYLSDPQFVIDPVSGQHRIGANSPAIDAGDNPSAAALQTDLEGMPRRLDDPNTPDTGNGTAPIVDIGAYEFYPVNVSVPSDVGACQGSQVTLQATATGFGALTYQWRRGDPVRVNINAATSSSYVINSYSSADADTYDVVVTDSRGTTTISSPIVVHDGATSITSFTPSSGGLGTLVTINGNGFLAVTDVRINGTSAVIRSVTDTQLIVAVSGSNTTGPITVLTAGGCTATSATNFTVAPYGSPASFVATATTPSSVTLTWNAVGGASSYVIQRSSLINTVQNLTTTADLGFVDATAQPNSAYLYRVQALQMGSGAPAASNKDLATTVIFAEDPIPPSSPIEATHWSEVRAAVNAVHVLAGYGAASFTNAFIPDNTIFANDLQELRDSLEVSLSALNLPIPTFTDTLQAGVTPIRKQHVEEIRSAVK